MRISDWSSDVCSSDLDPPDIVVTIDSPGFTRRVAQRLAGRSFPLVHDVAPPVWDWRPGRARRLARQIGRASCRERGCQYVSIWVVEVLFNTLNKPKPTSTT